MLVQILGSFLTFKVLFDFSGLILVQKDVVLHLFEVNLVVEIYDIFCLKCFLIYHTLCVYLGHVFFAGK